MLLILDQTFFWRLTEFPTYYAPSKKVGKFGSVSDNNNIFCSTLPQKVGFIPSILFAFLFLDWSIVNFEHTYFCTTLFLQPANVLWWENLTSLVSFISYSCYAIPERNCLWYLHILFYISGTRYLYLSICNFLLRTTLYNTPLETYLSYDKELCFKLKHKPIKIKCWKVCW